MSLCLQVKVGVLGLEEPVCLLSHNEKEKKLSMISYLDHWCPARVAPRPCVSAVSSSQKAPVPVTLPPFTTLPVLLLSAQLVWPPLLTQCFMPDWSDFSFHPLGWCAAPEHILERVKWNLQPPLNKHPSSGTGLESWLLCLGKAYFLSILWFRRVTIWSVITHIFLHLL